MHIYIFYLCREFFLIERRWVDTDEEISKFQEIVFVIVFANVLWGSIGREPETRTND